MKKTMMDDIFRQVLPNKPHLHVSKNQIHFTMEKTTVIKFVA